MKNERNNATGRFRVAVESHRVEISSSRCSEQSRRLLGGVSREFFGGLCVELENVRVTVKEVD